MKFIKLLALLPALLPVMILTSCDDDDYWNPPPPPGAGDNWVTLWSRSVNMPPICAYQIDPDTHDGSQWYDEYQDQVTILDSYSDLRYYLTDQQIRDYPDIDNFDWRRNSLVIYTRYSSSLVSDFEYYWGYYQNSYQDDYDLIVTFYSDSRAPRGYLVLAQAAFAVDKLSRNAQVHVDCDIR